MRPKRYSAFTFNSRAEYLKAKDSQYQKVTKDDWGSTSNLKSKIADSHWSVSLLKRANFQSVYSMWFMCKTFHIDIKKYVYCILSGCIIKKYIKFLFELLWHIRGENSDKVFFDIMCWYCCKKKTNPVSSSLDFLILS